VTNASSLTERTNPFSTRFTRPGALPFVFPPGDGMAAVLARLRQTAWTGSVAGPHGSGKSTLLYALARELPAAGRRWRLLERRAGESSPRLPPDSLTLDSLPLGKDSILLVDGYDGLARAWRRRIRRLCRQSGSGLVVTEHRRATLPLLFQTRVTAPIAERVIEQLIGRERAAELGEEITGQLETSGGNLRDVLFALYDLYESRGLC